MMTASPAGNEEGGDIRPDGAPAHGIVFFDGYCGLCNGFVDSIMKLPARERFRFSPRQGINFKALASRFPGIEHCDSIVYLPALANATPLVRSDAVIGIFLDIGGSRARLAGLLKIIPRPLRDFGYRVVARLRHAVSRRREVCRLPTPDERAYFID